MALLEMKDVSYAYRDGAGKRVVIFDKSSVSFEEGRFYTIYGPSGSGKTTALSLLGALESPDAGQVLYNGENITKTGFTKYRKNYSSLIFQNYNLINYMTALENVISAMEISSVKQKDKKAAALKYLTDIGLTEAEAKRSVGRLSGGQQQRVAIARAMAKNTKVILADEPTGNLDAKTARDIIAVFTRLAREYGKCVIVVSHAKEVGDAADTVYKLEDGEFQEIM